MKTPSQANLDYFENWTTQARKGVLELCILNALADGERYGYDLVKLLDAIPGSGVAEGTVYPLLSRLRLQGLVATRLVESAEGPARKYYALTETGRATTALMNDYWRQLSRQVEAPIRPTPEAAGTTANATPRRHD